MNLPRRIDTHADSVERDLAKLVLTVVELIRELMERQAVRRVDSGTLTAEETENLGLGLMHLEQAMTTMLNTFDLRADELNLDLGPLGTLTSPEKHG